MPSLKETLRQLKQTQDRQAAQRETEREKEAAARQREEEWQKKWEEDYPKAEADLRKAVAALDPLFRLLEEAGVSVEGASVKENISHSSRNGWVIYGKNITESYSDYDGYHLHIDYLGARWDVTLSHPKFPRIEKKISIRLYTVVGKNLFREKPKHYEGYLVLDVPNYSSTLFSTVFHISDVKEARDNLEQFLARQIRELYQK